MNFILIFVVTFLEMIHHLFFSFNFISIFVVTFLEMIRPHLFVNFIIFTSRNRGISKSIGTWMKKGATVPTTLRKLLCRFMNAFMIL